jgi:hypothetical protein
LPQGKSLAASRLLEGLAEAHVVVGAQAHPLMPADGPVGLRSDQVEGSPAAFSAVSRPSHQETPESSAAGPDGSLPHHASLRTALARSRCVLGELGGPQGLHCGRVGAKMLLIYLSLFTYPSMQQEDYDEQTD